MKDKYLTANKIFDNYEIGDIIIDKEYSLQYRLIEKNENPNIIMGYLAGSHVQIIKSFKLENTNGYSTKGEIRLYMSHNTKKYYEGDFFGKQFPENIYWNNQLLFRDFERYENIRMFEYIKYLEKKFGKYVKKN